MLCFGQCFVFIWYCCMIIYSSGNSFEESHLMHTYRNNALVKGIGLNSLSRARQSSIRLLWFLTIGMRFHKLDIDWPHYNYSQETNYKVLFKRGCHSKKDQVVPKLLLHYFFHWKCKLEKPKLINSRWRTRTPTLVLINYGSIWLCRTIGRSSYN